MWINVVTVTNIPKPIDATYVWSAHIHDLSVRRSQQRSQRSTVQGVGRVGVIRLQCHKRSLRNPARSGHVGDFAPPRGGSARCSEPWQAQ